MCVTCIDKIEMTEVSHTDSWAVEIYLDVLIFMFTQLSLVINAYKLSNYNFNGTDKQ